MWKTYYYRAPMVAGEIKTGMYCASDLADTIEIARHLRGPWEVASWRDRLHHTAIVRADEDDRYYGGVKRTIVEIV